MTNRYARQEALSEIGKKGQEKLGESSVAVIGIGALGTVTSELLTRSGVGRIMLVDKDKVDLVNLQRQVLFDENDVGKSKVEVAKEKLIKINSEVNIETQEIFLNENNCFLLDDYDLLLDCTDNMKVRHIINDYCEKKKKIWIYAAAVGTKGNVMVVNEHQKFRKIFQSGETFGSCEDVGILNSASVMISSIQVTESIKILTKQKNTEGLIRVDVWNNKIEIIKT